MEEEITQDETPPKLYNGNSVMFQFTIIVGDGMYITQTEKVPRQ